LVIQLLLQTAVAECFPGDYRGARLAGVQDAMRLVRLAGIVAGILFLVAFIWVVLLGPAALLLLTPRS
jgi:hypothetical protein